MDSSFSAKNRKTLVEDFNEFLIIDQLPYALTDFVWTEGTVHARGNFYETQKLTEYPRVIRKDSDFIHQLAIEPTLALLIDARFAACRRCSGLRQ